MNYVEDFELISGCSCPLSIMISIVLFPTYVELCFNLVVVIKWMGLAPSFLLQLVAITNFCC